MPLPRTQHSMRYVLFVGNCDVPHHVSSVPSYFHCTMPNSPTAVLESRRHDTPGFSFESATGNWPGRNSGRVIGTDETWTGIDTALYCGVRGLPGGSSLAKLLAEHRGVRNVQDLPPLTVEQILAWADAHKAARGGWPNAKSGQVTGTDETWAGINAALIRGNRGLPGGSSLSRLLAEHHHDPR